MGAHVVKFVAASSGLDVPGASCFGDHGGLRCRLLCVQSSCQSVSLQQAQHTTWSARKRQVATVGTT